MKYALLRRIYSRFLLLKIRHENLETLVVRKFWMFAIWCFLGLILSLFIFGRGVLSVTAQGTSIYDTAPQEQQGRTLYEMGDFSEAVRIWQEVARVYGDRGDVLNHARVLNNLAFAYQQLGQWNEAKEAIDRSLNLLNNSELSREGRSQSLQIIAQALNNRGGIELAIGQPEAALATWERATAAYTSSGDDTGVIRSLINQAQALKALGLYRRALTTLTETEKLLQKQPDSAVKAAGLNSFGSTLRLIGDLDKSREVLQQSLRIAEQLKSTPEIAAALSSLGDTARSQGDVKAALEFYRQASAISPFKIPKLKAQLNQLSLLVETKQSAEALALRSQIQPQFTDLPLSQAAIYAEINFAQSLMKLSTVNGGESQFKTENIARLLAKAVKDAKSLGDRRSQSYALGNLGGLYEQNSQRSDARKLTEQALLIAQAINAPDIAYRWQWQLGRLHKVEGNRQKAIVAYDGAVSTLQSLRSDLVAINPDIQFSFRESVEPVYREFVSLLLESGNSAETTKENIGQARNVIESLQLAELDNFFREACLDVKPAQIDRVDPQTAVIYPIILADRVEVILSLPNSPLRHYATFLLQNEVEDIIEKFRESLVIRSKRNFVPFSKQVYDWLIRPAETDLANSGVKTLVFVLDGALRNIPMAALNDGTQYLIEKYGIALSPGLQLLEPKFWRRSQPKVLGVGLTEARQGFPPLENVAQELKEIESEVNGEVLLNQQFTSENLRDKMRSSTFEIVHIATHGKFSSKAIDTFILAWDDRLSIDRVDALLESNDRSREQPIELLVFSACETAAGDKRAALGLAGMAVRAGARSTLASLWAVNDAATAELMSRFYKELTETQETKAEVLRLSQLSLLQNPLYKHPVYWAPYVLVGNWL